MYAYPSWTPLLAGTKDRIRKGHRSWRGRIHCHSMSGDYCSRRVRRRNIVHWHQTSDWREWKVHNRPGVYGLDDWDIQRWQKHTPQVCMGDCARLMGFVVKWRVFSWAWAWGQYSYVGDRPSQPYFRKEWIAMLLEILTVRTKFKSIRVLK